MNTSLRIWVGVMAASAAVAACGADDQSTQQPPSQQTDSSVVPEPELWKFLYVEEIRGA